MPDLDYTDGLLEPARHRSARCSVKALTLLSMLIGVGYTVLLGWAPGHPSGGEPAIAMAWQRAQPPRQSAQMVKARQVAARPLAAVKGSADAAPAESADGAAVVAEDALGATDTPIWSRRGTLAANLALVLGVGGIALPQSGLLQPQSFKGADDVMGDRAFGTCVAQAPSQLRWGADVKTADNIGCFNRMFAEMRGYWRTTSFLKTESAASGEITFYDTITGKPLFIAPRGRTFEEFVEESNTHGWPSFRDQEVVTENVKVLRDGETVSADGTHLGHNIPDFSGNRYCINLVSIAGFKDEQQK
jgi:peptide methionine sulfoxide reductase MsrB